MKKKKYSEPELELHRIYLNDALSASNMDPNTPEIGDGGGDEGGDDIEF